MGKYLNRNRKEYIKRRRKNREVMRKDIDSSEQQHTSTEPHTRTEPPNLENRQAKVDEMERKFQEYLLYKGFLNYNKYKARLLWLEKKSTFD